MCEAVSVPWKGPHLAAGSDKPEISPATVAIYNMRYCPYAERTMLVLLAKHIPFQVININLKKKPEFFLAETFGTVPVVLHEGHVIMESLINSDYLDEKFPAPRLHPEDPAQKAKDRVVLEVYSKMVAAFYACLFRAKDDEARAAAFKEICEVRQKMEKELEARDSLFFCGDGPGMLDWMMWPWFERYPVLSMWFPSLQFSESDRLDAWQEAMWRTEPVVKYGLTPEIHSKFYKESFSKEAELDYDITLE